MRRWPPQSSGIDVASQSEVRVRVSGCQPPIRLTDEMAEEALRQFLESKTHAYMKHA
jgi:hypothetical protein